MSSDNPNPLDDRRKGQEESYFNKQNQEATARLKAKTELEKVGIKDTELVEKLRLAGYDSDSARALFFIPLVEVAWADGNLQYEERKLIHELAEERGLKEGSKARELLEGWLSKKPEDKAYQVGFAELGPIFHDVSKMTGQSAEELLANSKKVAEAAGGLFGFHSTTLLEESALKKIAEKLKSS